MMNTMKRQMKIYRIFLAAAVAVLGMGLVSCKKDKSTDESKEYLTGSMNFSIPTYVMPGQQFHLVPTGVTKTDGGAPGIYWTDSYFSVRDTTRRENGAGDGAFDFTVPSDVTSMTLTCAPAAMPLSFVTPAEVMPELIAAHCAAVKEELLSEYSKLHAPGVPATNLYLSMREISVGVASAVGTCTNA